MSESLLTGVLSFVAYALGLGTVLTSLSVAAALSRRGLTTNLRKYLPYANRAGGAVLFMAGAYVSYIWGYSLFSHGYPQPDPVLSTGFHISGIFSNWINAPAGRAVIYGLAVLLLGLLVWLFLRRHFASLFRSSGSMQQDGRSETGRSDS